MTMDQPIARVMVAGTGVLGAQIAFQCAFSGIDVVTYDIDAASLDRANAHFGRKAATLDREITADGLPASSCA